MVQGRGEGHEGRVGVESEGIVGRHVRGRGGQPQEIWICDTHTKTCQWLGAEVGDGRGRRGGGAYSDPGLKRRHLGMWW